MEDVKNNELAYQLFQISEMLRTELNLEISAVWVREAARRFTPDRVLPPKYPYELSRKERQRPKSMNVSLQIK